MKKLIPPDPNRCQALKSNGVGFMTCGGKREMVRCLSKPTAVATERVPGPDGLIGPRRSATSVSMSCNGRCQQHDLKSITNKAP